MKRPLIALVLTAAGFVGLATHHTAFAAAGGNSDAAHACNQGGYAGLIGTDGLTDTTFANTGDCAAYAAHGGMLVSATDATPCLSAGYAVLAPSAGGNAFPSEAACVLFVGQGGTPVPYNPASRTGIIWGD